MKPTLLYFLFIVALLSDVVLLGQKNVIWQKIITVDSLNKVNKAALTSDGGFIIGGYTQHQFQSYTSNYNTDIYVAKLNSYGDIQWSKSIGDENRNLLKSIYETSDKGFVIGAWDKGQDTIILDNGRVHIRDVYRIIKLDYSGDIQADKTLSGTKDDFIFSVKETQDKGYIVGGHSNSISGKDMTRSVKGGKDWWILKLSLIHI